MWPIRKTLPFSSPWPGASVTPWLSGRRHQRLLRAGDDDVEAPRIRLERHRPEARDAVDDDERAGLFRHGRERLDVGDDAGRRLRVREEDDLRAADAIAHVVRARRL